jgi:hypothetical protein
MVVGQLTQELWERLSRKEFLQKIMREIFENQQKNQRLMHEMCTDFSTENTVVECGPVTQPTIKLDTKMSILRFDGYTIIAEKLNAWIRSLEAYNKNQAVRGCTTDHVGSSHGQSGL